jgi:hypothetical protein
MFAVFKHRIAAPNEAGITPILAIYPVKQARQSRPVNAASSSSKHDGLRYVRKPNAPNHPP